MCILPTNTINIIKLYANNKYDWHTRQPTSLSQWNIVPVIRYNSFIADRKLQQKQLNDQRTCNFRKYQNEILKEWFSIKFCLHCVGSLDT